MKRILHLFVCMLTGVLFLLAGYKGTWECDYADPGVKHVSSQAAAVTFSDVKAHKLFFHSIVQHGHGKHHTKPSRKLSNIKITLPVFLVLPADHVYVTLSASSGMSQAYHYLFYKTINPPPPKLIV